MWRLFTADEKAPLSFSVTVRHRGTDFAAMKRLLLKSQHKDPEQFKEFLKQQKKAELELKSLLFCGNLYLGFRNTSTWEQYDKAIGL